MPVMNDDFEDHKTDTSLCGSVSKFNNFVINAIHIRVIEKYFQLTEKDSIRLGDISVDKIEIHAEENPKSKVLKIFYSFDHNKHRWNDCVFLSFTNMLIFREDSYHV